MGGPDDPRISVIVVVQSYSACLGWTLERLSAQTIASELECILVTGAKEGVAPAERYAQGLHSLRVVECDRMDHPGSVKAAGVVAARAPLVAFVEDHSYPDPGWAAALLLTHSRGRYAAVGPVALNANPATRQSWGCFLAYYGMYMRAVPPDEVMHLPGNHTCYRRDDIMAYGARLAEVFQSEVALQGDLRARGLRLFHDPGARVYHLNYSSLNPAVREYFLASRVFASERRRGWPLVRKLVYLFGSPLLPFLRLSRIVGQARRAELPWTTLMPALWPAFVILWAGAVGEMAGYGFGAGDSPRRLMRFEREHASLFTAADLEEVALARHRADA